VLSWHEHIRNSHWPGKNITGPYFDADGVDLMADGGSPLLKISRSFIGPGHAGIVSENGTNWFSCHFYDGTRHGMPTLAVLPSNGRQTAGRKSSPIRQNKTKLSLY